MSDIIAIVGRPNVGKSALFNRLAGKRIAIVHDQPGVTRDRISAEVEWKGRPYTLIDTGGIGLIQGEQARDELTKAALTQVEMAIESAQVIIFVVNVREGLVPLDEEAAARLRRAGKPVLVAINKVDQDDARLGTVEFARLGFDDLFPVSALHGRGIDELMKAAMARLPSLSPALPAEEETETPPLKIAIVGRPNVGKSSLTNALTQSQRVVVSPIPGTTRDAIDVPFEVVSDGRRQKYILIDTAGLRKRRRVDDSIEFFSTKRAEDSIRRCDIAVLVLDAEAGILEQDKKIADLITEAQKACIVLVNKWDLAKADLDEAPEKAKKASRDRAARQAREEAPSLARFGQWVQERLFFLDYAPVIFTSAETRFNLNRLLEAIRYVAAQLQQSVPTAVLNRVLYDAIERRQPVNSAGHRLKFFYATQVEKAPPTFLLFVNRKDLFSPEYGKYLGDQIRRGFGYEGCPIILKARARPKIQIEKSGKKPGHRHQGRKPERGPRKNRR